MRAWHLAICLLFLVHGSAQGQDARIDGLRLTYAGAYRLDKAEKSETNSNISTGQWLRDEVVKDGAGTRFSFRDGLYIGISFDTLGRPRNANANLKVIWRYPAPGLVAPGSTSGKLTDEYIETTRIGTNHTLYWAFTSSEWVRVPGTWVLEVWDGNRKLLSQQFAMSR